MPSQAPPNPRTTMSRSVGKSAQPLTRSSMQSAFQLPPSEEEAEVGISVLKQICFSETHVQGPPKILYLFNLLCLNPSLKRMVVSLASDKAIWDAILKNEAVQELRESCITGLMLPSGCQGETGSILSEFWNAGRDIAIIILRWILENLKTKVHALLLLISQLVDELFHVVEPGTSMGGLDGILRSMFMLSLMVISIVIIIRIQQKYGPAR
ncbi:uncharacterized protein LOC121997846 isoform X1 [Zingiber officinale]|uniref:uncharacterized protein LOC121997846 isoform X1 n=1 Tax=Zingiber officinale TaxID=94328 RepID=UPI001C4AB05E|nr:uncharacterized protein LOC121997846 isoform X1 [Zingiber officinale]